MHLQQVVLNLIDQKGPEDVLGKELGRCLAVMASQQVSYEHNNVNIDAGHNINTNNKFYYHGIFLGSVRTVRLPYRVQRHAI